MGRVTYQSTGELYRVVLPIGTDESDIPVPVYASSLADAVTQIKRSLANFDGITVDRVEHHDYGKADSGQLRTLVLIYDGVAPIPLLLVYEHEPGEGYYDGRRVCKVGILDHKPLSVCVVNAMAARLKKHETFVSAFGMDLGNSNVNLKVLVNGVEVDLIGDVVDQFDKVFDKLDEHIKNEAVELVKNKATNLANLISAIDRAEWEIGEALKGIGVQA